MARPLFLNGNGVRAIWFLMLLSPAIFLFAILVVPFIGIIADFSGHIPFLSSVGSGIYGLLGRRAIYNSLVQGGISAFFSFIFGFPLGIYMGRYSAGLRRFLRSITVIPFFLPSIVVVIAFVSLFGPGSFLTSRLPVLGIFAQGLTGIVTVNVFFNAPLVAFLTSLAVERSDRSLEESAMTLGAGKFRVFYSVWGRDGILAAVSAAVLAFLYSFAGFAAPLIIGGVKNFTVEAWIYFIVKEEANLPLGVAFSIIQSLVLILPVLVYFLLWNRQRRVTSKSPDEYAKTGGRLVYMGKIYTALFIVAEFIILGSVILSSFDLKWNSHFTLSAYSGLFSNVTRNALGTDPSLPFLNTLFYGTMTAVISSSLGMLWIVGKRRVSARPDSIVDSTQFIPLVIPAIVMAFSVSIILGEHVSSSLTWVLIILVQTAVSIPVVLRMISSGFSRVPQSLSEAARILHGNAFFTVELPLAGTTLATALLFGFAISMGEFTATNFLSTSTFMPLSVEIYSLQSLRLTQEAYAAASLLLILSLVSFYLIQRFGESFVGIR